MRKKIVKNSLIAPLFLFSVLTNAQSNEEQKVAQTVKDYFAALNASNIDELVKQFTKKAVLLPTGAPTATGTEELIGNYTYVFNTIDFDLEVTIADVVIAGDYAFVRSTSKGTILLKKENQKLAQDFREVFILKKLNNYWKIDTYSYNQSK
ncbi:nuclear transport factor 2 family protein [Euzebyella marina]|uniref:Nuclear transport factor 2 family protein n=1 Tax=Euzebyella marina TaxID=1761453 RepID=A0A3G2L5B7_9FLAO|nr:nuclear transport factor 2 family protein [Euzebyella marina]AYN67396.1 nuclear transport factor 2 family protein [Euzebyella marina]